LVTSISFAKLNQWARSASENRLAYRATCSGCAALGYGFLLIHRMAGEHSQDQHTQWLEHSFISLIMPNWMSTDPPASVASARHAA
jgi:hypothetical protein